MTAMRKSDLSASIVASSSAVLPAPGDDMRLKATDAVGVEMLRDCARRRDRWRRAGAADGFDRGLSLGNAIVLVRDNVQPHVSHIAAPVRIFGNFEFDALQQHLVAGQQLGLPIATGLAQQAD